MRVAIGATLDKGLSQLPGFHGYRLIHSEMHPIAQPASSEIVRSRQNTFLLILAQEFQGIFKALSRGLWLPLPHSKMTQREVGKHEFRVRVNRPPQRKTCFLKQALLL